MHADIGRQSRQKGILEEAGRLFEFSWRGQRPHLVEQHGGAHISVDLGQHHEQLGLLVVAEVAQFDEPALQDGVWVVSRRNEELGDVLDAALLQGLNHVVVLGSVTLLVTNWASAWANQLLEFSWRGQRPHLVKQHGGGISLSTWGSAMNNSALS